MVIIIIYLIIWFHRFSSDMVNSGVERTNIIYGGLDLKATRVVYVHGSIDPWHALGVTSTRLTESPAIFINGISSYFPKFEVQSSYSFMLEKTMNAGCKVCLLESTCFNSLTETPVCGTRSKHEYWSTCANLRALPLITFLPQSLFAQQTSKPVSTQLERSTFQWYVFFSLLVSAARFFR